MSKFTKLLKSSPLERHEWTAPFSTPWRLEELMRELYKSERKSINQIARDLDCATRTVAMWLDRHGIEQRSRRMSYHLRDGGVQHYWNAEGYEYVRTEHDGDAFAVPVHKLVAIADGADPYYLFRDTDRGIVHHENEMKADNRHENLRTMNNDEHARLHAESGGTS